MTPATLSAEIDAAQAEFKRLNIRGKRIHRRLSKNVERLIVLAAERITRLQRFRSMLLAKEYAQDRHDWISPLDRNESNS